MTPDILPIVKIIGDMSMICLRESAVEYALAEAKKKVTEVGMENRGPEVDKYLIAAGVSKKTLTNTSVQGAKDRQWCGMFVYWCFLQASKKLGTALPFGGIDLWSGARLIQWANRHPDTIVDSDGGEPLQAGDIFTVTPPGHIGLIVGGPDDAGRVPTVEGNQSELASTWNGVLRKTIKPIKCSMVVRV